MMRYYLNAEFQGQRVDINFILFISAFVCILRNMCMKCFMISDPLYVEQHMRHDTLKTKTRIIEYWEGILKFRRHEISGNICSCIGWSELRNDVSSGDVHVSHRTICRTGGEMDMSRDLRHASKWNWRRVGANACNGLFSTVREVAALPRRPVWIAGLILSLATEIDFKISTELFGLIMTENGEEIGINNVYEVSKIT